MIFFFQLKAVACNVCQIHAYDQVYNNYEVCPPPNSPNRVYGTGLAVLTNDCLTRNFLEVTGSLPTYLSGNYTRVIPGVFQNSKRSATLLHVFDGVPVIHRWAFDGQGNVLFTSDFMRHDYYKILSDDQVKLPFAFQAVIGVACNGQTSCTRPGIENVRSITLGVLTNIQPHQVEIGYDTMIMLTDMFPVTQFDSSTLATGTTYGWGSMGHFNIDKGDLVEQLTRLLWIMGPAHPHRIHVGTHTGKTIRPAISLHPESIIGVANNSLVMVVMDHDLKLTQLGSTRLKGFPYAHSCFNAGRFIIYPGWAWNVNTQAMAKNVLASGIISMGLGAMDYDAHGSIKFYVFDMEQQKFRYSIQLPALPELVGWTNLHTLNAYPWRTAEGMDIIVLQLRRDVLRADGDVYNDLSVDKINQAYHSDQFIFDSAALVDIEFVELAIACPTGQVDHDNWCIKPWYRVRSIQPDGYRTNYIPGNPRKMLEFPVINAAFATRAIGYAWFINNGGIAKMQMPVYGSQERMREVATFRVSPGQMASEPQFVADPSLKNVEDAGVLLVNVADSPNNRGVMLVLDAATLKPVASITPPHGSNATNPMFALHSNWLAAID